MDTVFFRARLVVGLLLWSFYEDLAKTHLLVKKALPLWIVWHASLWLVTRVSLLALR